MIKSIFKEEYKKLIRKLKKARLEAGLSQVQVAKQLETNQSYISKIEIGERRVDVIELKILSDIYNKNINYFFE